MKLFTSFAEAEVLRTQWQNLVEQLGADLFATFDWCATWWKHFSTGRRLGIYTFWVKDELVAVFPLFRETLRWGPLAVRVVRLVGSDHAGTRCWPLFDASHLDEVIDQLLAALSHGEAWDLFHIGDLPGYFPQTDELITSLKRNGSRKLCVGRDFYPHAVFPIASSFEEYLENLSGNERNNVRKNERRLSTTHRLHSVIEGPDRCDEFLSQFFDWHDQHWRSQNELGFFSLWPGSRAFHAEIARIENTAGRSMLLRVYANDEPVGNVCAHRCGNRVHLFQAVRAPGNKWDSYGPGRLLHCELFRQCMAAGVSQVDAMSGFYEYKRRLGAQFLGLTTLMLVNNSAASRLRTRLFCHLIQLVNAIYFRAWLCKIGPYLRGKFRSRRFHPSFLYEGMARRFIRSRFIITAFGKNAAHGVELGNE